MPSGKTHTKINLISIPICCFILFVFFQATNILSLTIFSVGIIIGTIFLGPDLDIKSDIYRNWGVLRVFWAPYMKIMPHRSFLSHTIILGDVIRLGYLLLVFSPFLYAINRFILNGNLMEYTLHFKASLLIFISGICTASALHILSDVLNTKRKKVFKKKRSR